MRAEAGDVVGDEVVQPKCGDTTFGGYWFCVPHGPLRNNMEADGHEGEGHRLAWFCFGHSALEVP